MSNKSEGNNFEKAFCEMLFDEGFWVHNFTQNTYGQPADVIAIKEDKMFLIDCKRCASPWFRLSRVEDNQWCAMDLWERLTKGSAWFAMETVRGGIVYMLSFEDIKKAVGEGHRTINITDATCGKEFAEWVRCPS